MKFNETKMRDKIYACWTGKNIGGTMGTPYETCKDIQDIQGFVTKPGEALVNDDLDLQIVWLKAVEERGIKAINERILGEYWLTYIHPAWNEYGVGKSNMRAGFQPPLSGEITNEQWKHSNGAWIRTEIWACLFPGQPEKAIKYAFYDACVDHGYGDGTFAAIFTAAIESAAFVCNDMKKLLEIGLSKIPDDCLVAKAVRLVIEEYEKGTDWKTVREMVVAGFTERGWFQAPANIAFTVIGLLYGEGDFKKTLITAINCGDDTDCTGATAGALLGIMYGQDGIPEDWKSYIGDDIVVGCLLHGHCIYPKTCTELTDRVVHLQNSIQEYGKTILADEDDFSDVDLESFKGNEFATKLFNRQRYSFEADNVLVHATVELDSAPEISPLGTITGKITLFNNPDLPGQKRYQLRWLCQDGFTATGDLNLHVHEVHPHPGHVYYVEPSIGRFEIQAPEKVSAFQNIVLEITSPGRFTPLYISIPLMGK